MSGTVHTDFSQTVSDEELLGARNTLAGMTVMPVALCLAVALTALKGYAWFTTGSAALLADTLSSFISVAAAGFSLWSVVLSGIPPDESHPYGHGKIEFFTAGFKGALTILAAIAILVTGVSQMLSVHALQHLETGMVILLGTGMVNLGLAATLLRTGKRSKSLVLEAYGRHLLINVLSSAVVLGGLILVYATSLFQFDGWVACVVGLHMLFTAVSLVRRAFGDLMDESDPELLQEIGALLQKHRKSLWIEAHRLRAWKAGLQVHVDFHLILPRDLPLEQGHAEVKELERIFSDHFGGLAEILIHLDPCEDPECPVCGKEPCDLRAEESQQTELWDWRELTRDNPRSEYES